MDVWQSVIVGVVFFLLGAAAAWLVARGGKQAAQAAHAEAKAERDALRAQLDAVANDLRNAESSLAASEARGEQIEGLSAKVKDLEAERDGLEEKVVEFRQAEAAKIAQLAAKEESLQEQKRMLAEAEARLKDAFESLAAKALNESTSEFLKKANDKLEQMDKASAADLAERQKAVGELVQPLRERLQELDAFNRELEKGRQGAYEALIQQVKGLDARQSSLMHETSRLVRALQSPGKAGHWGEMVLERVVEMAGLEKGLHYEVQKSQDGDGGRQRPDMVVNLPGGRTMVIDAKAPMTQYLEALEADEDRKGQLMQAHARQVLNRAKELRARNYGENEKNAPDFSVLFIPSEAAYRAAMEANTSLMEEAMHGNVVMATPTSLIALLRVVAYGWREERLAEDAQKIQKEASELYGRLMKALSYFNSMGKALEVTNKHYNSMAASIESRLLPAARKMKDMGVGQGKELEEVTRLEIAPRLIDDLEEKEHPHSE
jgi:DNA recombination protein RmuC